MKRPSLVGTAIILCGIGLAALVLAALTLDAAVTVALPETFEGGGGPWECGSLWSFLVHNNTGFNGGEWSTEIQDYVLAECPPAANVARTGFFTTLALGAGALLGAVIVFLVHVRRTRARASV